MLSSSGSILQLRTGTGSVSALPSVNKPSSKQSILNAAPITRFNTRCSATKKSVNVIDKRFLGNRLRSSGSGRLHFWCSDGPGRSPKLKVVVRSALSSVPEKPLGLYDPSFDKDSCGVGFVAELSGESSRKTVIKYDYYIYIYISMYICMHVFE
jgi:glutamate synthase (NADPH/NADH)